MLSMETRYALKALVQLATTPTEPQSTNTIATAANIPRKFQEETILSNLRRHQIVTSRMGKRGGYVLARPAKDINFAEVIEVEADFPDLLRF